ncbi:MAG: GWxTD domain-containing protein, partial [Rhodothermales bacterium]|nr:GWxTD domain-containing protein [Rhodothermales bacterium]
AAEASYETSYYAALPEVEVEEQLRHADVIATGRERRQIGDLATMEQKRDFLVEFWRRRDENPATPINETRRAFYERIQYVQDRYSNAYGEGWETDRGRVILKYGYPSQVDPNLYDAEALPHEIWEYDNIPGTGQALFVFVDRTGFGDFELLHSNVTGELSAPDWQSRIRR